MAKFNVTVDLDWLDEEESIDDALRSEIMSKVAEKIVANTEKKISAETENFMKKYISEMETTVHERMNQIMEEFLTTPKNITNQWGEVVKEGVTVKGMLTEACDKFLDQKVDDNGKPDNSYYGTKQTRLQYYVNQVVNDSMKRKIDEAISVVMTKTKKELSDLIKARLGEKISEIVNIDEVVGRMVS